MGHFALDDGALTLKLSGKRGRTQKGVINLIGATLCESKADGAPAGAFDLITNSGEQYVISAADQLLAALKERQASGTMTALSFVKHGAAAEVMKVAMVPAPTTVPAGFALVRVYAAALNPVDKIRVEGGMKALRPEGAWPAVVGYDLSGVIEKLGDDAGQHAVGRSWGAEWVFDGAQLLRQLLHAHFSRRAP